MGMTRVSDLKAWAALLVVGLLATLLVLALSACGAGCTKDGAKARPLPKKGEALCPGEYRSQEFEPSLTFTVGKGWETVPVQEDTPSEVSDTLAIYRAEGDSTLRFRNVQRVYDYDKTGYTSHVVKAPKDMVGWLQHHPFLDTEKPEPATVGGVKGVQFDYIVSEDAPMSDIDVYRYADGSIGGAGEGHKYRAIILEGVKGKTVTIGIGSETPEFDDFLPEAQKVLDTVK